MIHLCKDLTTTSPPFLLLHTYMLQYTCTPGPPQLCAADKCTHCTGPSQFKLKTSPPPQDTTKQQMYNCFESGKCDSAPHLTSSPQIASKFKLKQCKSKLKQNASYSAALSKQADDFISNPLHVEYVHVCLGLIFLLICMHVYCKSYLQHWRSCHQNN